MLKVVEVAESVNHYNNYEFLSILGADSMSTILTHSVGPSLIAAVLFVVILIAIAAIAVTLIRQRMQKLSSGAEVESIPFGEYTQVLRLPLLISLRIR